MRTLIKILMLWLLFSHTDQKTWGAEALNDSNFQTAVNLWFSNESEANSTYGHISDWNVSAVTDMNSTFSMKTGFNEDIGDWDVSSVTSMVSMFDGATSFNQDIGDWDVSVVTTMEQMV